ncbi:hypothetical protein HY750_02915 [Candidatus Kuenenbacteria bacterium]|nr:hypothetical protein [Candidatus Kuenenbacteria bacterium]
MLEQNDLKKIGEVVEEKVNILRKEMKEEFNNVRGEMKEGFDNVDKEFGNVRKEMKDLHKETIEGVCEFVEQNVLPLINENTEEIKKLNQRISQTVTIDYLDEKLSDLRGDLVVLTRKEDKKVVRLVEMLQAKNILSKKEAKELLILEPFAQIF